VSQQTAHIDPFGLALSKLRSALRFVLSSPIFLAGLLVLAAVPVLAAPSAQAAGLAIGLVLAFIGMVDLPFVRSGARGLRLASARQIATLIQHDPAQCVLSTAAGEVQALNPAAKASIVQDRPFQGRIETFLAKFSASPDAMAARLMARALAQGFAMDELATHNGVLRLRVQRISMRAGDHLLWRIEKLEGSSFDIGGADRLGLPMLTANKAGAVLFCNQALRNLLGSRPRSLSDVIGPQAWRTGEEVALQTPSGPARVLLAEVPSHTQTTERREIYLLPLSTDPHSRNAPSTDFEHMPVALMIFSPTGEVRAANRAARDILGDVLRDDSFFHDLFDALGRPVSDWLADVAEERLPSGGQVLRLNTQRRQTGPDARPDRQDFVQVSLRRMVEHARPSVLAVIQDATALKTLEAQFVQSQKMQAIGQLAGGVAHDFNNLLTAISGNCDLLLLRHTGDDASYPDLVQIRQNANRAAALVSQLLAFSRKQTLQPEYLDLQDVFSDLTHLLNRLVGEKLRLELQHGAGLGTIRADRRQLEQVIVNLVVNARDAMPQGGAIRLQTEAVHLTENLVRDRANVPAGAYAVIRIVDTGIGIAPDLLQVIFEPFYTTKKSGEGTGLGLSTAYGIVKQSGGFIFVDSTLGEGTTFTLYFPIHNRPPTEVAQAAPKATVIRQGEGVVLLVEDEAPVRAFAARALRLRGYTVLEAATGEEALELLQDTSLAVDLFVSDVIMPGLDGPSWVRDAQQTRPNVPVIFVSGYAEDVMSEHQHRIPNSTFLPKPFSLSDLTLAVQAKLRSSDA
jgi:two-component system, cell cycle sensor histidine kinase and response regulator CckA